MARIFLIHWKAQEAAGHIERLRAAGHEVVYREQVNPGFNSYMREAKPDAVVIDLSRLPSHGRETAVYMRGHKSMRELPLVFVDGAADKVDAVRKLLPDAIYTMLPKIDSAIAAALKKRNTAPVVPPQMMDRYASRTSAQKLGVKPDTAVAVFDAPRGYAQVLGHLPERVTLLEDPDEACAVTVWFAHDPEGLIEAIPRMKRIASKSKLWVAWKKRSAAPGSRLSEDVVRNAAIDAGLVDYKVCAIDATWSGLALAVASKRVSS